MKSILKMTCRTIQRFLGRYIALMLIVALSAGFFAGLKITTDAMINTGNEYLADLSFYDFRLFSTLGFTEDNITELGKLGGVKAAEGSYSVDALVEQNDAVLPFKFLSLTDKINLVSVTDGRLPANNNECVVDDERFTENDIGKVIKISSDNSDATMEKLNYTEYTIVGLVNSPLYISLDRGTTNIGNGLINGYIYITPDSFNTEVYTEAAVVLSDTADIYSEEYDDIIERYEPDVTELADKLADERYQSILDEYHVTSEFAEQLGIDKPETYILTRDENAGYISFKNDTGIVGGVANIFPIFFIMISILVCMTTMTRMVDEERTQIGVLKALGLRNGAIMSKYFLYAASATIIGWAVGFFSCTWGLPKVLWFAYNAIYNFSPIKYLFSPKLALLTLVISLFFILGSTYLSCRNELRSVPATLMRPRAAKTGKRVFLERITPIWKRLSFLKKITIRNMLRYKQRMFMVLIGVGCCTGLVVTGFGIRDSMIDVGEMQYTDIQKYEIEASYVDDESGNEDLKEALSGIDGIDKYNEIYTEHTDVSANGESLGSVTLLCFENEDEAAGYWNFHHKEDILDFPSSGEAIISPKIAEKLGLSIGDEITIQNSDMDAGSVTVSGIFDNYIYDYIVLSGETYNDLFGDYVNNTLLISTVGDNEQVAKELTGLEQITSVSRLSITKDNITDALSCLNYIVLVVLLFSGALAFIVIFNLTNINLAERSREIATVEVLGFYPKETESYVLKENLILSFIASILGLPLGKLFHIVVMSMVRIDMITFDNRISPISYVAAFICSLLFAVIINRIMRHSIYKINMAESLKAVE